MAATLALQTALCQPGSLTLLLGPAERQAQELQRRVFEMYDGSGRMVPATKRTELQLHLSNGSRVIALPDSESTVRGYAAVSLLIVDEASRVSDSLYRSVRPMLAVSRGRLMALSTPFGQRGWFYEEWQSDRAWRRTRINACQCPRISRSFLQEERRALGERYYRQEYECSFEDVVGALFSFEDIQATMDDNDLQPLYVEAT